MSTNRILALGGVALLLYLAFRVVFPRTEVDYDMALTGRISGTFLSKRQHSFFLDGRKSPRYAFDGFTPLLPTGQRRGGQPGGSRLGQYLRIGDVVRKPAHNTLLTVQRGDSLTQWVCAPPLDTP